MKYLSTLACLLTAAVAIDPTVDLGYSKYKGVKTGDVTQWLGIRYAAAPLGDLRFKKPTDPVKTTTVQAANKVSLR